MLTIAGFLSCLVVLALLVGRVLAWCDTAPIIEQKRESWK